MRLVVQRVRKASVEVDGEVCGQIQSGLAVLVGVHVDDTDRDIEFCADKTVHLRIFPDDDGRMNRSVLESGGGVLAVSQFTLYGDCRKGRRPSFGTAAEPEVAERLYELYIQRVESHGVRVERGVFGTHMRVLIDNDGPVTLLIESPHSE